MLNKWSSNELIHTVITATTVSTIVTMNVVFLEFSLRQLQIFFGNFLSRSVSQHDHQSHKKD